MPLYHSLEITAQETAETERYNGIFTPRLLSVLKTIEHADIAKITPDEARTLTPEQIEKVNDALNDLQIAADKLDILFNYARTAYQLGK